jgi:uroporphyrinogen III methyltransferase/synthase
VIYDHMVNVRVLEAAHPDAERIDVGGAAPQDSDQEAICYLLAEKAREGKVIARLKWSDPFVFGHGGEEALFLHEQGIPFEVIPGVPAATGVPAYAGIPVFYPGGGDTVTIVRGHEDEGREKTRIDWESLARLNGTIVCYVGPNQLLKMLDALLTHGRSADESAAVVSTARCRRSEPRRAPWPRWRASSGNTAPAARRFSSSAGSLGFASICDGSTRDRFLAGASW